MTRVVLKAGLILSLGIGCLLFMMWLLNAGLSGASAAGPILYVAPTGSDTTDCTNNTNPCATIQHAVDRADAGAEIRVATGVYTGVHVRPRNDVASGGVVTQVAYISKTITLRGGYTTTNWIDSYPVTQPTTLDAQGRGRVLYVTGDISPTIEGLRITGGDVASLGSLPDGGNWGNGVFVISASVVISNNHIFSNGLLSPNLAGGGIYLVYGSAVLNNNAIYSNAAHLGGGLLLWSSTVTLVGNTISGNGIDPMTTDSRGGGIVLVSSDAALVSNTITANAAYGGGGLNAWSSSATLIGNRIDSNAGYNGGGGAFEQGSTVTAAGNTVVSNTAWASGGGLYVDQSNAMIDRNTVTSNTTYSFSGGTGGGALYILSSNATVVGNVIALNTSGAIGGGVYLLGGDVRLVNNSVISNSALMGGGFGGDGMLTGNTFAANSALIGGGLALGGSVRLNGDIIISNTAGQGGGLAMQSANVVLTNTIIADNEATVEGSGVLVYDSSLESRHATIARNRGGDSSGILVGAPSTVLLTNTIVVSHSLGITVSPGGMAMMESTLWGSGVWSNGTDWDGEGTIMTGTVNVWGNPAFVSSDAGDYHIGPDSAAIDAGVSAGVDVDVDGEPRPDGLGYDIGADEYRRRSRIYLPIVIRS